MLLATACWFTWVGDDVVQIGVTNRVPKRLRKCPALPELVPGKWTCSSALEFRDRYLDQLARLDAADVVARIEGIAGGRDAVLCGWAKPTAALVGEGFCHRGLIAAWLYDTTGLIVPEVMAGSIGFGWGHPLIPESLRNGHVVPAKLRLHP